MTYSFILRFQNQNDLNSVYEMLMEKSKLIEFRKFFNPANVLRRFTIVIECGEQDIGEFLESLESYFLQFYSDIDISLLSVHEPEIDKMIPI